MPADSSIGALRRRWIRFSEMHRPPSVGERHWTSGWSCCLLQCHPRLSRIAPWEANRRKSAPERCFACIPAILRQVKWFPITTLGSLAAYETSAVLCFVHRHLGWWSLFRSDQEGSQGFQARREAGEIGRAHV